MVVGILHKLGAAARWIGAATWVVLKWGLPCAVLFWLIVRAAAPIWPQAERMAREGTAAGATPPPAVLAGTLVAMAAIVLLGLLARAREGCR